MTTRRRFLAAIAALAPGLGRAQSARTHRIAVLFGGQKEGNATFFEAFREQLAKLGYVEGRNLILDARFGASSPDRAKSLADELLQRNPEIFVGLQGLAVGTASRVAATLPAVIIASGNPVDAGYVTGFAKHGRNITGISLLALELAGKRMELLKELEPRLRTVAVVADPQHPGEHRERAVSEDAARKLGIRVLYRPVRNGDELKAALAATRAEGAEAIVAFPDGVTTTNREAIADFSIRQRMPAVGGWASFVEAGCLLSYGPNQRAAYARAAYFVDRILKGTSAGDLPIELPSVVELAINRKTASSLGITIPQSILLRADRVIE